MNKTSFKKILEHPDKDEIISKLVIGMSAKDIHDWLASKYTNVSEAKFVISEKSIKSFQDNYLDMYNYMLEDISKTKAALTPTGSVEDQLELAVQSNPTYNSKMIEIASENLDVRQMVSRLCAAIEVRFAQVFDEIQSDPRNINTRVDRMLKEYGELLGTLLDRYYKFTEEKSDQIVQHNVAIQIVDQQVSILHNALKEVIAEFDNERSLQFMEKVNDRISKLKMPSSDKDPSYEDRLADAKILSETINKKINE